MKKILLRVLFSALISVMILGATPILAATPEATPDDNGTVIIHAEQTTWYYRPYEGRYQRRLWSNTYVKWLTDWEDC